MNGGKKVGRIAIVGGWPPPYGGVGVGVKRLAGLLDSAGRPYIVYNTISDVQIPGRVVSVARCRSWWMLKYLATCREPVVIFRVSNILAYAAGALLHRLRRKRTCVFFGNMSLLGMARTRPRSFAGRLIRWTLRNADLLVGTSAEICGTLQGLGAAGERVRHIPGFLLPRGEVDRAVVDSAIQEFCSTHGPLLLAMAKLTRNQEGQSVYGVDLLLDMMAKLRPAFPKVGLLLLVPYDHDLVAEKWPRLQHEVKVRKLGGVVYPYLMSEEMFPLLRHVDVYVRPTRTEGDANSVREAMYLGTPVVASDCAARPDGVVTFSSGDAEALAATVQEVLEHLPTYKARAGRFTVKDSSDLYLRLIDELCSGLEGD